MNKKIVFGILLMIGMITSITLVKSASAQKDSKGQATSNLAPILVEDFTYTAGALLVDNGWAAHSGAGTNALATASPGLTFTGYPGSGVGNAVPMTISGEDAHRTFTAQTTGTTYAGFLANFSEAAIDANGIGGYFFHLGGDPIGTAFRGRVFVQKNATGSLAFGISKATSSVAADISYTPFNYSLNTTYLFIVKYTVVDGATNDTVNLFVNTTTPASEPAPTVSAPDVGAGDIVPASIAIRQGANATSPTLTVDGIRVATNWADIVSSVAAPQQHVVDFNGDGKTDFVVARNTGGGTGGQVTWFTQLNGGALQGAQWGISTDAFLPEDYDGDNKTDYAVWRSGAPTVAAFYILQSQTNTLRVETFGQTGDNPTVVGDYDGDGKADVAVYRAGAQSTWYYRGTLNNPSGNVTFVPWGTTGDFVAPGDYDGDGKNDFVVQRDNGGGQARFWMSQTTAGFDSVVFGTPADFVVPGDYDGDGKTDIATARGGGGSILWFVRPSSTGTISAVPTATFGVLATDFAVQGDYDGDGKTDIAIWRPGAPGTFWYLGSTSGALSAQFGQTGDTPVANYNTH